ncbi:MAG: dihydrofolate reductase [Alphaproteobacteria bacterium]
MAYDGCRVVMVVAMARNRVIGRNGTIPWRIPADLKHFKAATMGKPMVMGRKTFESIGRPLAGRTSIVVTRQADWSADGVLTALSIEAGLDLAVRDARARGVPEIAVVGGGEIYAASLPFADEISLTRIDAEIDGDTRFLPLDPESWVFGPAEPFPEDPRASHAADLVTVTRRPPA